MENLTDIIEEEEDEKMLNSEDRWYQDNDDQVKEAASFDLCPIIPISKDEFDEWCKPWHAALIVKVLGKGVHLAFMEQRLNRDEVKKGKINVIDMDRNYFLVHFSDEGDYSYTLTRGSWMIVKHYLIRVGSALGTMLKIDKVTSINSRGRFAKICMEIDLSRKLFSAYFDAREHSQH
ncbi:hypothetical protein Ahy_B04g069227 [Arachis hypogaea]|uniref:DUF4283 domain-containing protein n=1 Tax=Arachis hypogaea TaxID=3818 RepID=A0A444ZBZ2_ARAHY|nr:hypothetical protein Ahy_B04g069227 [Arachis hypogaea]